MAKLLIRIAFALVFALVVENVCAFKFRNRIPRQTDEIPPYLESLQGKLSELFGRTANGVQQIAQRVDRTLGQIGTNIPVDSQGFRGSQDSQGFQGAQGSQDFRGFQGSQGFQGAQGSQGFRGSQGSQVYQRS